MSDPLDRIFSASNPLHEKEEWFFMSREGNKGPFPSHGDAVRAVAEYVKFCIECDLNGDRFNLGGLEVEDWTMPLWSNAGYA